MQDKLDTEVSLDTKQNTKRSSCAAGPEGKRTDQKSNPLKSYMMMDEPWHPNIRRRFYQSAVRVGQVGKQTIN